MTGSNRSARVGNATGAERPDSICPVHGHTVASICAHCGIRNIAVCAALENAELGELEAIMTHSQLAAGQPLVFEGDPVKHAYNVISGGIKLFKGMADGRAQITGYLLPGDFLGLPPRGAYVFSAEALGATELCRFPRDALKRVFDRHEKLQDRFLTVVHDDLVAAQEHMLLLGRKTAMERLCTFLVRLMRRTELVGGSVEPLRLPLLRADIADYLGLTVETVSRTFSQLRKNESIRLEKADRVFVLDRARLEEIADGARYSSA